MRVGRKRAIGAASAALVVLALVSAGMLAGCAKQEPVTVSEQVLGTVVTITAWGDDPAALNRGAEAAFAQMAAVEAELDPYDATSSIAVFNRDLGYETTLPPSAVEILDRVDMLSVGRYFSPALFGVTKLYGFGTSETVPATATLQLAMWQVGWFTRDSKDHAHFAVDHGPRLIGVPDPPPPGLDFGGAAKGLALDRALAKLRATPGIRAAMISTVSSTVVWGRKPDGEPWRVGVEDPRETGKVLAVISAEDTRTLNISTSGDYQTYFERDGVRYHHILDPATGRPARGLRSLTVFGRISGTDADILSTALFVMGRDRALEYAKEHRFGIYLVDDTGRASEWVPKDLAGAALEVKAEPKP